MTHEDESALQFFSRLGGRLELELTQPTHAVSEKLTNQIAPADAGIVSVSFRMYAFDDAGIRELTNDEWDRVVLHASQLRMRDERTPDTFLEVSAANGATFSVRDLARAVEATELHCRARTDWFGGIDTHHVFFEGMTLGKDGVWELHWGS